MLEVKFFSHLLTHFLATCCYLRSTNGRNYCLHLWRSSDRSSGAKRNRKTERHAHVHKAVQTTYLFKKRKQFTVTEAATTTTPTAAAAPDSDDKTDEGGTRGQTAPETASHQIPPPSSSSHPTLIAWPPHPLPWQSVMKPSTWRCPGLWRWHPRPRETWSKTPADTGDSVRTQVLQQTTGQWPREHRLANQREKYWLVLCICWCHQAYLLSGNVPGTLEELCSSPIWRGGHCGRHCLSPRKWSLDDLIFINLLSKYCLLQ